MLVKCQGREVCLSTIYKDNIRSLECNERDNEVK